MSVLMTFQVTLFGTALNLRFQFFGDLFWGLDYNLDRKLEQVSVNLNWVNENVFERISVSMKTY